jgi:energy-coupling factor transporter ATP-binding protein EcfA2
MFHLFCFCVEAQSYSTADLMTSTSSGERIVYMIGPESGGKSTLVLQLQSIIVQRGLIRLQEELVVAPTTGQEMCTLQVPATTTICNWLHLDDNDGAADAAIADKSGPSSSLARTNSGAHFQSIAPNDSLERTNGSVPVFSPTRQPPSRRFPPGAASTAAQPQEAAVTVSVRELGGRMASSWSKFISTAAAKHPVCGVVFVVSIVASWQIPLASIEFVSMLSDSITTASETRVLLVLNKCGSPDFAVSAFEAGSLLSPMPRRMKERDIVEAFLRPLDQSLASRVDVVWIDTWLGIGLVDVLMWLRRAAE